MKISCKNIENWRSWKMRFFWGGHFEFFKSAILNFFLLHISEKPSPFIWGIIFFCTMDGFSRILEKKGGGLLCTPLYFPKQKVLSEVLVVFVWTEKKIYILSNQSVVNWKSSPTTYKQGKNQSDYYILSLDSVLFKCTSILSRTHNCCLELHCFA